jgi:hypothetical protein
MRVLVLPAIAGLIAILAAPSAWPQPAGRSADIHRPLDQVYAGLDNYFSPDSMHDFQVVSRTRTKSKVEIVAKRTVMDKMKWSTWAYCEVPATQMLDTLQQGNITLRVKLDRESANRTYVTVTPDFEGQYQFAGNSTTRPCASNGVLEKDILRAAGATDTELH